MARYFALITKEELRSKVEKTLFFDYDSASFNPYLIRKKLGKDLKVAFSFENFDYDQEESPHCLNILGYRTLDNGLTFLGMRAAGDWEHPVYFICYFDGKKLRGYVPTGGNPWNLTTKKAYGNDELADWEDARKRYPDCPEDPEDLDGWFDSDEEEIIKDIKTRILPLPKPKTETLREKVENLKYEADCDEVSELFYATRDLAIKMSGLGLIDKAEVLYNWALEIKNL